jgi:putative aldouronate transport system permease protein
MIRSPTGPGSPPAKEVGQLRSPPRLGLTRGIRRYLTRNGPFLLMALPGILVIFIFAYLPMPGLILAFKNYRFADGIWGSAWVGLNNFRFLFSTGDAWRIIWNTLFLNTLFLVFTNVLAGLLVALLLNEIRGQSVPVHSLFPPLYLVCDCQLFHLCHTQRRQRSGE